MTYPLSYWERTSLHRPYDLIVIGAGIVGLTAAAVYAERRPGSRVLVLERGWYPAGATTRNAGFACFGSIGELLDDLQQETDEAVYDRFFRRYDGLQALQTRLSGFDTGYEACGNFEVFETPEAYREAVAALPFFNDWARRCSGETGVFFTTEINGKPAIGNRLEGVLDSGKLALALLEKARKAGVEVRFNSRADLVESNRVVCGEVELQAAAILVAANGFASQLLPGIGIEPARGLVLVTHPIDGMPWKGGFHYHKGYVYFRHLPDGRLLLGGARHLSKSTEQTTEFGENPAISAFLKRFADDYLGLKGRWTPDIVWSGIMGFPPTKTPVLREVAPGLATAAGLGGIGVAIGTRTAIEAVDRLLG